MLISNQPSSFILLSFHHDVDLKNSAFSSSSSCHSINSNKSFQTHQTQSNLLHSNNLGPFRIPKESIKSNSSIDHLNWNQLNWNQTFKRSFLTLRNLLIVGIGTSIGTLVIYSILSELFAPSSMTNLIISITQTISTSTSLHQILIPPHLFHTSTSSKQILSSSHSNHHLPQHLEIRLMIEGSKSYPEIQTDYLTLAFYQTLLKRYLSPLITSKIKEDSLEDQMKRKEERMKQKESKEMESMKDGWKDWMKSVLANLMITQTKENPKKRLNWFESQRPSLGEYQTGEVIAEIIKVECLIMNL
ncbi:hypothetical protein DFH28DRAFT_985949 [Melampsora americana]|nr:hypothetical protein DFH28DRAFT_985949 [Melampsora americana]